MELLRLTLTEVLTVLGIAGGIVIVLYLLKLRRRRIVVPFEGEKRRADVQIRRGG